MSQAKSYEEVALNLDWSRRMLAVRGYSSSVGTSFETIGTNPMELPSAAGEFYICSDSTSDDVAGTGGFGYSISGLNENWDLLTLSGNLDGQTSVTLSPNMIRCNDIKITAVGSTGYNQGIVSLGSGTNTGGVPSTIYRSIPVGMNTDQDLWCSVPKSYEAMVTRLEISSQNTSPVHVQIWTKDNQTGTPIQLRYQCVCDTTPATISFKDLNVGQKTDIYVHAKSSSAVSDVCGYLEYMTRYVPASII